MFGPFEHQVLEQVGEARPALAFVLRPDVIPHVDTDDGNMMVLVYQHFQAVVERMFREWKIHARLRTCEAPPQS